MSLLIHSDEKLLAYYAKRGKNYRPRSGSCWRDVTAYDLHGKNAFLAALKDVYSRKAAGFAVSTKNNTALVKAALKNANGNMTPVECEALYQ